MTCFSPAPLALSLGLIVVGITAGCSAPDPGATDAIGTDGGGARDGGDAALGADAWAAIDAPSPRDGGESIDAGPLSAADADVAVDAAIGEDDAAAVGSDAWSSELDVGPPPADTGSDASLPTRVCPHAAALQASTDAELARQAISGVALGIDMPGCEWIGASGVADRSTSRAMVAPDRFRIASITKTFTAAVVLQLVDEGTLRLTDRLSSYVAFPGGDGITIRQLLAHTSGIYDYFNSPPVMAAYDEPWTRRQVLDVAAAQPLAFVPGAEWDYSNTNYFLLGLVIEDVTGRPYHEEVRRRLLVPLGLDDTYLAGPESLPGGLVRGYDQVGGSFVDVTDSVDPSLTWAAGGIVSTVEDLDDWTRALFTGDVLSVATRTAMLTPEPLPGGRVAPNGLCIQVQSLPRGLGTFYSHTGRLPGFFTMLGYLPTHDAVMVELTNDEDGGPNPFMTEMWEAVGLL
jgi:D-alanyl-D-alanine carboxypeptidase